MKARLLWCSYGVGTGEVLFLSFLGRCAGTADWETRVGWRGGKGQFCLSACLVATGRSLGSFFSRALQGNLQGEQQIFLRLFAGGGDFGSLDLSVVCVCVPMWFELQSPL